MDEEMGVFSEDEKRWLKECIIRWTVGIKPTLEEWNGFSLERRNFYFDYAKQQKLLDLMELAKAFGNEDYVAIVYDSCFRMPGEAGLQTELASKRDSEMRKIEKMMLRERM